jgi:xanthine/uracil/vitamin C permease (AzgA family)
MTANRTLLYGLGGGVGLFLSVYAFQSYLWYGYQKANPTIGTVSTTPGFEIVIAGLFIIGVGIAFTEFSRGLAHALDTTTKYDAGSD